MWLSPGQRTQLSSVDFYRSSILRRFSSIKSQFSMLNFVFQCWKLFFERFRTFFNHWKNNFQCWILFFNLEIVLRTMKNVFLHHWKTTKSPFTLARHCRSDIVIRWRDIHQVMAAFTQVAWCRLSSRRQKISLVVLFLPTTSKRYQIGPTMSC